MTHHPLTPSPSPPLTLLEPRFSLPPETPCSSKRCVVIGGIEVFIYGLDELPEGTTETAVLFLAHMRTRTYTVTEAMAHEILHRYRSADNSRKMIAVTMDMRNHGAREICRSANLTWKDGNENHALDLIALIDGSAHDFHLVIDLLPCYLPQFTTFHNYVMGISLGGHMTYRLALRLKPGQVEKYIIVVGSPTLSSLLLDRLHVSVPGVPTEELDTLTPSQLDSILDDKQKRKWPPRTVGALVRNADQKVLEHFPDVPTLLCCGSVDPLVPPSFTVSWLKRRKPLGKNTKLFIQDNTGHSCTKEMIGMISDWLA